MPRPYDSDHEGHAKHSLLGDSSHVQSHGIHDAIGQHSGSAKVHSPQVGRMPSNRLSELPSEKVQRPPHLLSSKFRKGSTSLDQSPPGKALPCPSCAGRHVDTSVLSQKLSTAEASIQTFLEEAKDERAAAALARLEASAARAQADTAQRELEAAIHRTRTAERDLQRFQAAWSEVQNLLVQKKGTTKFTSQPAASPLRRNQIAHKQRTSRLSSRRTHSSPKVQNRQHRAHLARAHTPQKLSRSPVLATAPKSPLHVPRPDSSPPPSKEPEADLPDPHRRDQLVALVKCTNTSLGQYTIGSAPIRSRPSDKSICSHESLEKHEHASCPSRAYPTPGPSVENEVACQNVDICEAGRKHDPPDTDATVPEAEVAPASKCSLATSPFQSGNVFPTFATPGTAVPQKMVRRREGSSSLPSEPTGRCESDDDDDDGDTGISHQQAGSISELVHWNSPSAEAPCTLVSSQGRKRARGPRKSAPGRLGEGGAGPTFDVGTKEGEPSKPSLSGSAVHHGRAIRPVRSTKRPRPPASPAAQRRTSRLSYPAMAPVVLGNDLRPAGQISMYRELQYMEQGPSTAKAKPPPDTRSGPVAAGFPEQQPVVRNRTERKHMIGVDCSCCSKVRSSSYSTCCDLRILNHFISASFVSRMRIDRMNPFLLQWFESKRRSLLAYHHGDIDKAHAELREYLQATSRHRVHYAPDTEEEPCEPMGFPGETQWLLGETGSSDELKRTT